MTAITRYECNLCKRYIDESVPTGRVPDGWPLRWSGHFGAIPSEGDNLEASMWNTAPVHLCQNCVRAVGLVRDWVRRESKLRGDPGVKS